MEEQSAAAEKESWNVEVKFPMNCLKFEAMLEKKCLFFKATDEDGC